MAESSGDQASRPTAPTRQLVDFDVEARLAAIVESSNDAIIAKQLDGTIVSWNRGAERLYGYTELEVRGSNIAVIVPEDRRVEIEMIRNRIGCGERVPRFSTLRLRKDGSTVPVSLMVSPILNELGEVLGASTIAHDITAEIESRRQLQELADRLQISYTIDQAILESRTVTEIVRVTISHLAVPLPFPFCCVCKLSPTGVAEVVGLRSTAPMPPTAGFELPGLTLTALRSDSDGTVLQTSGTEARHLLPPEWPDALTQASVTRIAVFPLIADNEPVGILEFGLDSLDQFSSDRAEVARYVAKSLALALKQARIRDDLKSQSERLEAMVAERTRELEERVQEVERLNEAQLRLVRDLESTNASLKRRSEDLLMANGDLETFSYSVSHDLRAPLRAVRGFSEILSRRFRKDLPERGQRYLDNVVEAGGHMDQLIEDLTTYSRLGRRGVERVPVSLDALFVRLRRDFGPQIDDKQAHVIVASSLPEVLGDETLLYQIFANLLDNALKYQSREHITRVVVDWDSQGERITVRVQDNGIGIAREYHEKILQVFQRLHSSEIPGTGIGLGIVKKAVSMLGGRVWLESTPGEGTRFFVELSRTPNGDHQE